MCVCVCVCDIYIYDIYIYTTSVKWTVLGQPGARLNKIIF